EGGEEREGELHVHPWGLWPKERLAHPRQGRNSTLGHVRQRACPKVRWRGRRVARILLSRIRGARAWPPLAAKSGREPAPAALRISRGPRTMNPNQSRHIAALALVPFVGAAQA